MCRGRTNRISERRETYQGGLVVASGMSAYGFPREQHRDAFQFAVVAGRRDDRPGLVGVSRRLLASRFSSTARFVDHTLRSLSGGWALRVIGQENGHRVSKHLRKLGQLAARQCQCRHFEKDRSFWGAPYPLSPIGLEIISIASPAAHGTVLASNRRAARTAAPARESYGGFARYPIATQEARSRVSFSSASHPASRHLNSPTALPGPSRSYEARRNESLIGEADEPDSNHTRSRRANRRRLLRV
jgi:hypothetical protein